MKKIKTSYLTIFFCLFVTPILFSQVEGLKLSKNHYREYGFESTSVLRYLSLFEDTDQATNLSVSIRRHKRGKRGATRWVINAGIVEDFGTELVNVGLSWGKEYHKDLVNRWAIYSGFEFSILTQDGFFSNTPFDAIFGVAPIYGVRFKISPLIYISTEGAVNVQFGTGFRTRGISLNTALPSLLHINFRFRSKKSY